MPANSRKEPKKQEHKRGANPARVWGPASLRRSTRFAPRWTVSTKFAIAEERVVTGSGKKYPDPALITLFGAVGAVLPIILLLLDRSEIPDLIGFTVLVWPTSIFMTELQQSPGYIAASTFLLPVLSNVALYLVVGSLLWLGLVRPRSIVYLTIVGFIYLTVVGFAEFCSLLVS